MTQAPHINFVIIGALGLDFRRECVFRANCCVCALFDRLGLAKIAHYSLWRRMRQDEEIPDCDIPVYYSSIMKRFDTYKRVLVQGQPSGYGHFIPVLPFEVRSSEWGGDIESFWYLSTRSVFVVFTPDLNGL